jgi:Tetratricopeptide repeat
MYWCGEACFDQEKYSEAGTIWKEELEIRRDIQGPRHQQVARVLGRLGETYHLTSRPYEARQCTEEAISIQKEVDNPDDAGLLERLEELISSIEKTISDSGPAASQDKEKSTIGTPPPPQSVKPERELVMGKERDSTSPHRSAAPEWEVETAEDAPDPGDEDEPVVAPDTRSRSPSPVPRPISPFQQRSLFGRQPNQWSMFF